MIIIDQTFKGADDLHEYLRTQAGFKEATQEEREAWKYNTPLWTSPSNFIGCDLIYRGEEVGPITEVHIHTTARGLKAISFNTAKGNYKLSYSSVRFHNKLYGKEQVISLHPARGGLYMWSRGFVMGEKDYKALYYQTEEYQVKRDKTMEMKYGKGVTAPFHVPEIKERSKATMRKRYGVDNFLVRGSHYSAITNTMIEKYGVANIIHSSDFLERCGQCTSKGEQELARYLVDELGLHDSMYYTTGDTRQAVVMDPETYGSYQVDFMNERIGLIVEFYGDYWHCHPDLYKGDYLHETNGKTASEIWDADARRIERLKELTGYEVIVVWEQDWMNKKAAEKERLKSILLELTSQNQE